MKIKRMAGNNINFEKGLAISANKIKSSEYFSKQATHLDHWTEHIIEAHHCNI